MPLLRDVPASAFAEAARAYASLGVLLEGRYRTAAEHTLVRGPTVLVQVLDVHETAASLRGEAVPDIEAAVTVARGRRVLARAVRARMAWVPEQLVWRSPPTGAVSAEGAQFVDALHGCVLKHDPEAADRALPTQFMWRRGDAPSALREQ